ncbi:alpha/beta fold hydrolase [Yimella sp. cx-573]|nr:alpha/beta fold hydrolase [Yimella sp. cx-573]
MSRRFVASIAAAVLGMTVAPGVTSATPAQAATGISWKACADNKAHQCATVRVPLDWKQPNGPTTTVAVERRRASLPSKRIGAIFVNPGGPGESATAKTASFATLLGRSVTDRFDIIAIDPRGVGRSNPLMCTTPAGVSLPPTLDPTFPATVGEARRELKYDNAVRLACKKTGGPLLDHMTTADVARDMDAVRGLIGDPHLTYVGFSYGTVLGQTYAAMFPGRVRAMVLDGVLDAGEWTAGPAARAIPVGGRIHSGEGAWGAVKEAYRQCSKAGRDKCRSAVGGVNEWHTVWQRMINRGPVTMMGRTYQWTDLVTGTLYALYDPSTVPEALDEVHNLYLTVTGKPLPPDAGLAPRRTPPTRPGFGWSAAAAPGDSVPAAKSAVMCSDSVNPTDPMATWRAAIGTRSATVGFNSAWTWNTSQCTLWPASGNSAYRGSFKVRPATPILFMNPLYDPATSVTAARIAHANAPGSRLVTGNRIGHILLNDSACAVKIRTHYLLTQQLPTRNVACTDVKSIY